MRSERAACAAARPAPFSAAARARRCGRPGALFDTLLPRLAIDLRRRRRPILRDSVSRSPLDDVRLEIGFGGGEHLIAEAERHPQTRLHRHRAVRQRHGEGACRDRRRGNLANIRLHHGDADRLLAWLPAASLARVDLLYPDPWPKRRHWKRRFVQDESVARDCARAAPGRRIPLRHRHCRLCRLDAAPRPALAAISHGRAERADDWRRPWPDFAGTRYEAKAKREGRTPCYLTFRRRE